ncbi:hypothetical protein [Microbacterium sp. CFBP 13617]|uniref:hypothetical protein n=1 Tax=Microbacterium sp. CFBP 13617 TaxID=2774035 RepID=UPI002018099B|nr:hypothetical protein [Microbacterium sp. CFBP 13617]
MIGISDGREFSDLRQLSYAYVDRSCDYDVMHDLRPAADEQARPGVYVDDSADTQIHVIADRDPWTRWMTQHSAGVDLQTSTDLTAPAADPKGPDCSANSAGDAKSCFAKSES